MTISWMQLIGCELAVFYAVELAVENHEQDWRSIIGCTMVN